METFTLTISTFKKSHPGYARHFYGVVRDEQGNEKLTVFQSATRQSVIEKARAGCREHYGNVKLVVAPGVKDW